jgi:hypothetical protein
MFKYLLLVFLVSSCASGPSNKELSYQGEPLSDIAPHGLVVGHAMVPLDTFPHDNRKTIIYLENIKNKKLYEYGRTQGPFFMKLPPGEYVVKNLWSGGTCNASTGLMVSNFFIELPLDLSSLRPRFEKEAKTPLTFQISSGKMTDIGNLLLTCMEWDAREKFKKDFANFIKDGKFEVYQVLDRDAQECGCKIIQKFDGIPQKKMKEILRND